MTDEEVLSIVYEVIKELPDDVRKSLEQVSITVEDRPNAVQMARLRGAGKHQILGLYDGVPFPHQNIFTSMIHPPTITLFRKNLERYYPDREVLKQEIQFTLLHEIGHHLGLTEEDLRQRNW